MRFCVDNIVRYTAVGKGRGVGKMVKYAYIYCNRVFVNLGFVVCDYGIHIDRRQFTFRYLYGVNRVFFLK